MHSLEISIKNTDTASTDGFEPATATFVEELTSVPGLEVTAQAKKVEGTRGIITLLTGIVVLGTKIGAFSAIYTLAKDLYARYAGAEVELKFEDGSTLILKNLSEKEAAERIAKHLKRDQ